MLRVKSLLPSKMSFIFKTVVWWFTHAGVKSWNQGQRCHLGQHQTTKYRHNQLLLKVRSAWKCLVPKLLLGLSSRGKFQPQMWKWSRVKYTVKWVFWKGKREEKTKTLQASCRAGREDTKERTQGKAESLHDFQLWSWASRKAWISCLCPVLWAKIFSDRNKTETHTLIPELSFLEVRPRTFKGAGSKLLWF